VLRVTERADQPPAETSAELPTEIEITKLMAELTRERKPTLTGPYYNTPDGTEGIAASIWERVDPSSLAETFDAVKWTLSTNGSGPSSNGSIEIERIFKLSEDEKDALAKAAGSHAARQAVELLRSAEAATENFELNGRDSIEGTSTT
jgi:hypothetical protein